MSKLQRAVTDRALIHNSYDVMVNFTGAARLAACVVTLYLAAEAQVFRMPPPLIFPHFAQGGGYQTTFTLTNPSNAPTVATVTLGSLPLATIQTVSLPANGSARLALTETALTVGSAKITTFPGVEIDAVVTIQLSGGGVVRAEASTPASIPDVRLRVPVLEKDSVATGVAIVNPAETATTLTLALRSPDGATAGVLNMPLEAGEKVTKFIAEFFPGVSDFEGSLEILSNTPVAAYALRQHASGAFSQIPVATASSMVIDSVFSPRGGVAAAIVQEMRQAQTSMDIAIYSFTRNEIGDALIAAKNRGVAIRVLTDSGQAPQAGSEIARLEAAGIPVKRIAGIAASGIMHNKYAIFDGRVLLTGSYNWSTNAEENSFENVLFIRNTATIAAYQANFNFIWDTR